MHTRKKKTKICIASDIEKMITSIARDYCNEVLFTRAGADLEVREFVNGDLVRKYGADKLKLIFRRVYS